MKEQPTEPEPANDDLIDLTVAETQAGETKGGETAAYAQHEGAFMGNLFSSTPTAK